jgi:hypothetical protein
MALFFRLILNYAIQLNRYARYKAQRIKTLTNANTFKIYLEIVISMTILTLKGVNAPSIPHEFNAYNYAKSAKKFKHAVQIPGN